MVLPMLAAALLASNPAPLVALNHFFVVPDAGTFAAIQAAPFLRNEFALFEQRTTVRTDLTYTGVYFYGRTTYFEFLPPGSAMPDGASGIGFGVETPGAGDVLKARLAASLKVPVESPVVTRRAGNEDVPWFKNVRVGAAPATSRFYTWLMEYAPAFLERWYPELPPASREITRANVLTRYAAKLGQPDARSSRWLRDVTGVTVALDDAERAFLLPQLEAYGYRVETAGAGVVAHGPDVMLTIRPASASERGIVEVQFAVGPGAPTPRERRFGTSSLVFAGDGSAQWRFTSLTTDR
jgi:Family of unknown function (DUF5829)